MSNVIPFPKQEDVSKNNDEFKETLRELRLAMAAILKASGYENDPHVQEFIKKAEAE